jgi:hypothetical protein
MPFPSLLQCYFFLTVSLFICTLLTGGKVRADIRLHPASGIETQLAQTNRFLHLLYGGFGGWSDLVGPLF